MPPPEQFTIAAVLKWIGLQTIAVLAMVVPTTWFVAQYAYEKLGVVAANDPHKTVLFILGLAVVETILFCPVMIIPISTLVSRLEMARTELEKLASTDSLTGLLNRRGFEAGVARRLRSTAAALVADIDGFKAVNDRYGHDFGDQALRELGALLRASAESVGGVAARFGGEEFVVFVGGRPMHEIVALAEALRVGFQNRPIEHDGERAHLTISIGVAFAEGSVALAPMIADADRALYEAKRAGRNRVSVAESPALRAAA